MQLVTVVQVPVQRHRFPPAPSGALVLVDAELLLELVDRANPGKHLTVDWGSPVVVETWQAVYTPAFTEHREEPT